MLSLTVTTDVAQFSTVRVSAALILPLSRKQIATFTAALFASTIASSIFATSVFLLTALVFHKFETECLLLAIDQDYWTSLGLMKSRMHPYQ